MDICRDDSSVGVMIEHDGIGFDPAVAGVVPGRNRRFLAFFGVCERLDHIYGRFKN